MASGVGVGVGTGVDAAVGTSVAVAVGTGVAVAFGVGVAVGTSAGVAVTTTTSGDDWQAIKIAPTAPMTIALFTAVLSRTRSRPDRATTAFATTAREGAAAAAQAP